MILRILICGLMLCSVYPCGAQSRSTASRQEMDLLVNPRAIRQTVLVFEQQELQIPDISEDDAPATLVFPFSNRGAEPIVITQVVATCGCIAADYDRKPIPANGSGSIRVTFKPKGHPGKLFRKVFVYTNLWPQSPTAQLVIEGEVRPTSDPWSGYAHQIGALRVRRQAVTFRNIPQSGKLAECIECVNGGDKSVFVTMNAAALPPYITFRTHPQAIEPGRTADLIFAIDTSKMPQEMPREITISCVLEGLDDTASQRTIRVTIIR